MTKRYLTWHVDRIRGDNGSQGPLYYAEADYIPVGVRVMARVAPRGRDMQVDIRVDGVSIFDSDKALLMEGQTLDEYPGNWASASPSIAQGSVVSFHVLDSGDAEDVTCQLEVDSENWRSVMDTRFEALVLDFAALTGRVEALEQERAERERVVEVPESAEAAPEAAPAPKRLFTRRAPKEPKE